MARFFMLHYVAYPTLHLSILCATQHVPNQVMVRLRKKARPQLAVRGHPHTAAVAAEGLRNRCNDANLAQPIVEGVTRIAAGRSVDQLAREENKTLVGLIKLRGAEPKNPLASASTTRANG